jgi:hypothetical protein
LIVKSYLAQSPAEADARANYFFGKPVDGGDVSVKASGIDVGVFEAGAINGRTDSDGAWYFDPQLPAYFAGRPTTQGAAQVLVEATVKDSAGHSESRAEPITVSDQPILITAVPEGGTLIPGLENQVFIVTSYPDGQPAVTEIKVRGERHGILRYGESLRRGPERDPPHPAVAGITTAVRRKLETRHAIH